MTKCGFCGSTILMGGVQEGTSRYCNETCRRDGQVLAVARRIPAAELDRKLNEVWRGKCPKCGGAGPIDVHDVYRVYSVFLLTRWTTKRLICCQACGRSEQLGGLFFSLLLGWWGIPWGVILTPVQIVRNIKGMTNGPKVAQPSAALRTLVSVQVATQHIKEGSLPAEQPRRANADSASSATTAGIPSDSRRNGVAVEASQRPRDARARARQGEADIPVRPGSLIAFYVCLLFAMVLLPGFVPRMFFWTILIPYFIWQKERPRRAKKWLLHSSIAMGLCILFFWIPIKPFLFSLVPR